MILALLTSLACMSMDVNAKEGATVRTAETGTQAAPPPPPGMEVAVFAGGCFWCMEGPLEAVKGVATVTSGYTGGKELHPTYEDVGYHRTTHYEANRVVYDPTVVSYAELLEVYWHNIDPTQSNGQFCDRGDQYRSAVFTSDPEELKAAWGIWEALYDRALSLGGTLSAEHGVGKLKAPYLRKLVGAQGIQEFEALKRAIDPAWTVSYTHLTLPTTPYV